LHQQISFSQNKNPKQDSSCKGLQPQKRLDK